MAQTGNAHARRVLVGLVALAACTEKPASLENFFAAATELPYTQSSLDLDHCLTSENVCEPEYFSGGIAVGDIDGNGFEDLVVTRIGQSDLVYLNDGTRFEQGDWGLEVAAQTNGAALFDADNDGDLDLYVTVLGEPEAAAPNHRYYAFRNVGDRFELDDMGLSFESERGHAGTSIAVGDYNRDGFADLHVNEWKSSEGANAVGHPHERLLRNDGTGRFEDVTLTAGVFMADPLCRDDELSCRAHSFASTFSDLDDDGWPDLAIAADFERSRLFWGSAGGTFIDGTEAAGVGTDENGMGSTMGDYDGDGDLDWFVTSIYDAEDCGPSGCGWARSGNRLYRNEGNREFTDVTDEAGVRDGGWGWGAAFLDFDNDADLDLVMTNGMDIPEYPLDDHFANDPLRLWLNEDGVMREVSTEVGLDHREQGRGLCVFDKDNDGDQDLVIVTNGGGAQIFENRQGNRRRWLQLQLRNRQGGIAYGAKVTVRGSRTQVAEVGTGAHFLCSPSTVVHFGLDADTQVDITVRWPDGELSHHPDAATNQRIAIDQ